MSHPHPSPPAADVVWPVPGTEPHRTSLLVLPHAGGNAHAYSGWRDHLPQHVRLLIGQYPGRGARFSEPLPQELDDLAAPVVDALPPDTEDLVVLGHSMGSLVAFEVARLLKAQGRAPRSLIVSACRAPFLPNPSVVQPELLDDDQLVAAIKERGGTEDGVLDDAELRDIVLPPIRADFSIDDVYRYRGELPSLDCPVTALGGDADQVAPATALAEWAQVTSGGFSHASLPGGHFYFQHQLGAFFTHVMSVVDGSLVDHHSTV